MALDPSPIAQSVAELLDELEDRYPDAVLANAVIIVEVEEADCNVVEHRALRPSTAWAAGLAGGLAARLNVNGADDDE